MSNYEETFQLRGNLYNQAMKLAPNAREAERKALLDLLGAKPGETIYDAPAGGGYVADALGSLVSPGGTVACIEPSARFAEAIRDSFTVYNAPMEATGLPDASADRIASLAGLHHFADKRPVFSEWARLLKPGGTCAVADVRLGSAVDPFLNEFVHAGTPGGHEGDFFNEGDFVTLLEGAGFSKIEERTIQVPWVFENRETMVQFCHLLFGLKNYTPNQVAEGIDRLLRVDVMSDGTISMEWELLYASGKM